ncbi:hypothetical protein HS1genome_1770 [Sulfodiicoccus acidiphilus]|uniref:Uncharacterized protein n=1 Tax=Sulfodiicoccus acidiphilus TaxID=1670455 RepID=A0A348B5C9_9CREN|nr:hypothetical protein [Sulfodiicoccus acidiphilus]BBD73381.1 hypothetical protein HS1genome_1770 [Sulfodiicoccus acidiphilus]
MIVVPNSLHVALSPVIGGKGKGVIKEDLTKEEISTVAYLASGLQLEAYDVVSRVEEPFQDLLSGARRWLRREHVDLDVPNEGEESDLHRNLKAFAVKHLIEKEGIDPKAIFVEVYVDRLKPDIITPNLAADAKTSIGVLPSDEVLDATKYSSISKRIWVVLSPLPLLLELDGVTGRVREAREKGIELDVVVSTKDGLLKLREFLEEGRKYYEGLKGGG